tara:strand:+ start:243 stop:1241 length:999 start_codon:yes stop_codon:yes gene_type:complete
MTPTGGVLGAKNQFNRVVHILEKIQSGCYPTARSIAEEYEVSERTIRRDIEWMKDFHHAPIEFDRHHNGYILTDPTYRLPALTITEGELLAITVGEQVLGAYRNSPWHGPVQDAFARIESLLPEQVTVSAQLFSRKVSVITPPVSEIRSDVWAGVLEGTRRTRAVEIGYYRAAEKRVHRRTVHPYRLIAHDGSWYLVGWSLHHDAVRVFSLARIHSAKILPEAFDVPEDFSVGDYIDPEFGVYNRVDDGPREICIRFDPEVAHVVSERRWHSSQQLSELEDGRVELRFTTNQTDQVLYRVMSFGPAAEIVAPEDLRERARDWAGRMLARYQR